jgi:hypothetical protein
MTKHSAGAAELVTFRLSAEGARRLAALQQPGESAHQTARRLTLAHVDLRHDQELLAERVAELASTVSELQSDFRARHKDLALLSEALKFLVKRGEERDIQEGARAEHDVELRHLIAHSVQTLAERVEGLDQAIERLASSL